MRESRPFAKIYINASLWLEFYLERNSYYFASSILVVFSIFCSFNPFFFFISNPLFFALFSLYAYFYYSFLFCPGSFVMIVSFFVRTSFDGKGNAIFANGN